MFDNIYHGGTTDEMEPKKPEEKTSPVKEILSWVLTIAFAIVAAILIKNYVIINANIPSGSMENTIQIGDDIFGFRLAYTFSCSPYSCFNKCLIIYIMAVQPMVPSTTL